MKMKKFGGTEKKVYDLCRPIADDLGFTLWDVCYEKEGAYYYLRIYADSPNGMTMQDCEKLTRPINEAIDKADPIAGQYILEVGSAGLERKLDQPWHFTETLGMTVRARAVRPINGEKEWIGVLTDVTAETITVQSAGADEAVTLPLSDLSYVKRYIEVTF